MNANIEDESHEMQPTEEFQRQFKTVFDAVAETAYYSFGARNVNLVGSIFS